MAGRPRKEGATDNRGGARPGAGRKKRFSISETGRINMLKEAKKEAKARGMSLDKVLLGWAYDGDAKISLQAIRIFKEFTMNKVTEQHVDVTEHHAPVALPESRPDPAKVLQLAVKE